VNEAVYFFFSTSPLLKRVAKLLAYAAVVVAGTWKGEESCLELFFFKLFSTLKRNPVPYLEVECLDV
jgi:hypothetical protein